MIDKIIEILSEFAELSAEEINESTELVNDLGLNSLDAVNVIVAFEDEFEIEIPDKIIKDLSTIGDILKYIEKMYKFYYFNDIEAISDEIL